MSTVVEEQAGQITLTESAADAVRAILERQDKQGYGLRVFVQGGGCSGFQYGMTLEEKPEETDRVYEHHGVPVFVDPTSYSYLKGAHIDFVETIMGGGFKVENPNAVASCGCGHSFRTQDSPEGSCCG